MNTEPRTCCYCIHSDACAPDDKPVKCWIDIGELIYDVVEEALNCLDFQYDDHFPKT